MAFRAPALRHRPSAHSKTHNDPREQRQWPELGRRCGEAQEGAGLRTTRKKHPVLRELMFQARTWITHRVHQMDISAMEVRQEGKGTQKLPESRQASLVSRVNRDSQERGRCTIALWPR